MKIKVKKVLKEGSPKAPPPAKMHRLRHRSMQTQVDAIRCLYYQLIMELEEKYGKTRLMNKLFGNDDSASEMYYAFLRGRTQAEEVLKFMEKHAAVEYPEGIPDTV